MKMHKSIKADAAGRINLGKQCAGRLFTLSRENEKIVLEPARIVSESELRSREVIENIVLNENEWSKFEEIMESDDEPNKKLHQLMKDTD